MIPYLHLYLLYNLFPLFLMWLDKRKAIKHKRRISERTLLTIALCFGALGIGMGMLYFHHKTRKKKFIILVPIFITIQCYFIYQLW